MSRHFDEEFNTIIIGGGIVGAGIFRDLCLHKIPTLLIDRQDFSSKTSQSSSKMLHGGIRYLENMDFELVEEALHEKNLWLKIAPHLCFEERFYLPVYADSKRPLWMIKIGLFLYDLLSGFKNTPHESIAGHESLRRIPILNPKSLSGCGIYSDAIVDDAKMTLELIYDGCLFPKSKALNYHEFLSEELIDGKHFVKIKDTLTQKEKIIKVKNIVYATGPFTDETMKKVSHINWSPVLLPSKGSHLWFKKESIPLSNPVVMTTKDDRVIFVIPQGELVLVGTTEIKTNEDFNQVKISEAEITYLLTMLNNYFPKLNLTKKDIIGSFSGIRPLVRVEQSIELGKTSREHKIYQPTPTTFVITGGKYTTFRVMGQSITEQILLKENQIYFQDLSMQPLRKKSIILPFKFKVPTDEELKLIIKTEMPRTFDDLLRRRIGINSKEMWNYQADIDFDEYFSSKSHIIQLPDVSGDK